MKKKDIEMSEIFFINKWMKDYFNTTIEEEMARDPEPFKHSSWFNRYQVTQAQHDEWYEWAIGIFMKYYNVKRQYAEKAFGLPYLNTSPAVKKD